MSGHRDVKRSLMSSLESRAEPAPPLPAPGPRVWKFWGTTLWGALVFAAMFAGQFLLVAGVFVAKGPPFDFGSIKSVAGSGTVISLSVIMGLPAVAAVLWLAIRLSGSTFAEYLALRRISWANLAIGILAL